MIRRVLPSSILIVVAALAACSPKRVLREAATGPPPDADRPAATAAPAPPAGAYRLGLEAATLARAQLGRPYRWGGESPERGFDCSGLVQWCYGSLGVELPRVVSGQRRVGRTVPKHRLRPGDLVFFAIDRRRVSHVGLYVGDGEFVHAPRSGRPVRTDALDDPYWRTRWQDARRVAAE